MIWQSAFGILLSARTIVRWNLWGHKKSKSWSGAGTGMASSWAGAPCLRPGSLAEASRDRKKNVATTVCWDYHRRLCVTRFGMARSVRLGSAWLCITKWSFCVDETAFSKKT